MATLEQIETAIRNADKAGRTADVLALAKERQRLLAEQGKPATPTGEFVRPQAPPADYSQAAAPVAKPVVQQKSAIDEGGIYALPGIGPILKSFSDVSGNVERGAADVLTLGTADEAGAALNAAAGGGTYDDLLAQNRAALANSGKAGTAGQLIGAALLPGGAGLKSAVGMGGAYGFGSGEDGLPNRLGSAAIGAATGAVAQPLGKLAGWGMEKLAQGSGKLLDTVLPAAIKPELVKTIPAVVTPTAQEIKAHSQAAFKTATAQGAILNKKGFTDLVKDIHSDLTGMSYHPGNEPGVQGVVDMMQQYAKQGNVTLEGLHALRRRAQNGWRPGMGSNNAAIAKIVQRIDDMAEKAAKDPSLMAATGNPQTAVTAWKKGMSEWNKFRKIETIENLANKGEAVGSTMKTQDIAGRKRKEILKIFTNDKIGRGFTKAEREAAVNAARPSAAAQGMDAIQGLNPMHGRLQGGLGAATFLHNAGRAILSGGSDVHALANLGLQGLGWTAAKASQRMSERLAQASIDDFAHLVATGSLPKEVFTNALQKMTREKREAVQKLLARGGVLATVQ